MIISESENGVSTARSETAATGVLPFAGLSASVVLSNDSPLGSWFSCDFKYYFTPIESPSYANPATQVPATSYAWSLNASAGIQFHL